VPVSIRANVYWKPKGGFNRSSQHRDSWARRQNLSKPFGRRVPPEGLEGPVVELGRNRGEALGVVRAQVRALGEVLAQQPVGVLVAAALPGARRIAEVDRDVPGARELEVAPIESTRLAKDQCLGVELERAYRFISSPFLTVIHGYSQALTWANACSCGRGASVGSTRSAADVSESLTMRTNQSPLVSGFVPRKRQSRSRRSNDPRLSPGRLVTKPDRPLGIS
jgi:hypothetical protein